MKPILRWAGSKRQTLKLLSKYWYSGNYKRYVEPFAGSACLFFKLIPQDAILSDSNKELINSYKQIKNNLAEVYDILSRYKRGRKFYYMVRASNPEDLTFSERTARFIYLNRFCFNGIFRTNMKGEFNVPYGGNKSGCIPEYIDFLECRKALKKARILCCDFETTLQLCQKGDFVYLDPPYSVNSKRVFKEYGPDIFGEFDIFRLRDSIERLNKSGIALLLSYGKCEEAEYLGEGFYSETIDVKRNISGFIGSRRVDQEVIISNIKIA